jgi:hypothetical protein
MARPARSPSLSLETIDERRASLAAIGPALAKDGEVLLWSCETGRGARGAAFLAALAQASGASVAAASGRVGAAAPGGGWALDGAALRAPLTALGIAAYTGVMVAINWLGPKGSKGKPTSGTWNTTTNWDAGKVPGRSDDVNLGGNSAYTVTLDTTGNVKSLTIANNDATLAIGTQTLNIDIANTASSSISVTNGHVTIRRRQDCRQRGLALASGTDLSGSGNLSTTQRRDRHRHGPGCGPARDLGGRLRPDCHQSAGGGRRRHPTARS